MDCRKGDEVNDEDWEYGVLRDAGLLKYRLENGSTIVDDEGDRYELDPDDLDMLRPIVSVEGARNFLAQLVVPPVQLLDAPSSKRARFYINAYNSGDLQQQVDALRLIYFDDRDDPAERSNVKRFENLLLTEFARATGTTVRALKSQLHQAIDGTPPPASATAPDRVQELSQTRVPTAPDGYRHAESLWVDGELVITGLTEVDYRGPAEAGAWHVYVDAAHEFPDRALFIHHDRRLVSQPNSPPDDTTIRIPFEAASIAVIDGQFADDQDFVEMLMMSGGSATEARAVLVHLGGDGSAKLVPSITSGKLTMVIADLT